MKKIIYNKMYNTETATVIGSDSYSYPNDFNYWEETLYQKKNGEYFLHGEGGPLTKYRKYSSYNSWGGGEEIIPMTHDEAREWAEEHLDADAYIAAFGEVEE